jgi:hypothetical protein
MGPKEGQNAEASAVERVANAAREVQLASEALEELFIKADGSSRTLQLARLTAAIAELQSAREELDALLARKSLH